jgi:hypothetical protein
LPTCMPFFSVLKAAVAPAIAVMGSIIFSL